MVFIYALAVLCGVGGGFSIILLIAHTFLTNYGDCAIVVNNDRRFVVDGGCSLLDALYEHEMYIPSACGGQATCGYCKVTVTSGGGPVLPTEMTFLSADEQRTGVRLACQVKVKQDIEVTIRADYLNVKKFSAQVKAARELTHDTRELTIRLDEPGGISFIPGQYIQVEVPTTGGTEYRAYSIASPPERSDEIELVVRLIPGGLGSTYLHSIEPGTEIMFTGPYGEFELPEEGDIEIVCVAGGCGMAPVRSLVYYYATRAPRTPFWLFFGARTYNDIFYEDEYRELKHRFPGLRVYYALSEPEPEKEWEGETGFIHTVVDKHLTAGGRRKAFLCGPPPMVDAATMVLIEKGIPGEEIFYDAF